MRKMTKAQRKNLVKSIRSKSVKLYMMGEMSGMTTKDFEAIDKICNKLMKKIQSQ